MLTESNFVPAGLKDRTPGAYILTHLASGMKYVGSTGGAGERQYRHLYHLRRGLHVNKLLQEAYDEHPEMAFTWFEAKDREHAYDMEQVLLDRYKDSGMLFNTTFNARSSMIGRVVTAETRKKISEGNRGKKMTPSQKEALMKGRRNWVMPDELRKRISERMRGYIPSQETRRLISQKNKGRIVSQETKDRISRAHAARPLSEEARVRLINQSMKLRRAVIADGVRYDSIADAARAHELTVAGAFSRVRSSKRPSWRYE